MPLIWRNGKDFPRADFVLELLSPSDSLSDAQAKMQEYMDNGVKLGWLIEPETRRVEIYRTGRSVKELESPTTLSATVKTFSIGIEPSQLQC